MNDRETMIELSLLGGKKHSLNTAAEARDPSAALKDEPAIIDLVTVLPEVTEPEKKGDCPQFVDEIWKALQGAEKGVRYVGIRLSLEQLQAQRAAITWGLSWEQTVEDFAAELYLFPRLLALSEFRHLFLCCGSHGLVHIENVKASARASTRLRGKLYFSQKDFWQEGTNAASVENILTLLKQLKQERDQRTGPPNKLSQAPSLHGAVSAEIPEFVLARPMPNEPRPPRRWHILNRSLEDAPVHRINVAVAIVRADLDNVLNREWKEPQKTEDDKHDLWPTLTRVEFWNPHDRAPDFVTLPARSQPAMPAQLRRGLPVIKGKHDHQSFCLAVPIAQFGQLVVAEREQVENLHDIRGLFEAYIYDKQIGRKDDNDTNKEFRHPQPLSIAVFGPPGAGKSFAVKEIAKSINEKMEFLEFNLAQFQKPEDLTSAFRKLKLKYPPTPATTTTSPTNTSPTNTSPTNTSPTNTASLIDTTNPTNTSGHIDTTNPTNNFPPVVFFDEFDFALGSENLGWLRYFLAPMQDGKYYDEEGCDGTGAKFEDLPRSIFVFAGGIHTSFEKFDPRVELPGPDLARAVSEEYRKEIERFETRKGPDFISRLRGYINIPDPNAEPGRSKHFLRRALQLRGLMKGKLLIRDDEKGRIKITEEIIYALLTVDRYRHGVRSMEAILRMCNLVNDGWINVPSLPSRAQLNMHVNADEFFIRLHRGRARMDGTPETNLGKKLAELAERANACGDDLIEQSGVKGLLTEFEKLLLTAEQQRRVGFL